MGATAPILTGETKMNKAPITVILPSEIFTIIGNQFVAIASDCEKASGASILDRNGNEWYFHIRSHKTNQLAKFVVDREIRKDNKTAALQLVCKDHGGLVATIIND
jgi:hypothetical protein